MPEIIEGKPADKAPIIIPGTPAPAPSKAPLTALPRPETVAPMPDHTLLFSTFDVLLSFKVSAKAVIAAPAALRACAATLAPAACSSNPCAKVFDAFTDCSSALARSPFVLICWARAFLCSSSKAFKLFI